MIKQIIFMLLVIMTPLLAIADVFHDSRTETIIETMDRWRDEARKKQEEDTAQYQAELKRVEELAIASTSKQIYMGSGGMLLLVSLLIMNAKKEKGKVDYHKKFGIILILLSILISIFVIMISDGWYANYDLIHNIINKLTIVVGGDGYREAALIDIPTKYVLFLLLTFASYGLAVYLGAVPAVKKSTFDFLWKDRISEQ